MANLFPPPRWLLPFHLPRTKRTDEYARAYQRERMCASDRYEGMKTVKLGYEKSN